MLGLPAGKKDNAGDVADLIDDLAEGVFRAHNIVDVELVNCPPVNPLWGAAYVVNSSLSIDQNFTL